MVVMIIMLLMYYILKTTLLPFFFPFCSLSSLSSWLTSLLRLLLRQVANHNHGWGSINRDATQLHYYGYSGCFFCFHCNSLHIIGQQLHLIIFIGSCHRLLALINLVIDGAVDHRCYLLSLMPSITISIPVSLSPTRSTTTHSLTLWAIILVYARTS